MVKLIWQKVIKGEGKFKMIYYLAICSRCKQELRVHQEGQKRVAEGLHLLSCENENTN